MSVYYLQPGDMIEAAKDILNDGSFPSEKELLVSKGTKGVIVNIGYLEENDEKLVFLIRFEGEDDYLGQPIGCWEEDIQSLASEVEN